MFSEVHALVGQAGDIVLYVHDDLALPTAWDGAAQFPDFAASPGELHEAVLDGLRVVLVGMGPHAHADAWIPTGNLGRRIAELKTREVTLLGDGLDYAVIGCAFEVLCWNPNTYKGTGSKAKPRPELNVYLPDEAAVMAFAQGKELGVCINLSRTLSWTPPNIAHPEFMSEQAEKLAAEVGLTFREIAGDELEEEGLVGHINVGKASEVEPRMLRLEYAPEDASGDPLVLVGKTVTYDTGGLSLKPREGMVGMKFDKDGGCAVLGAMRAIATVYKPKCRVVALLCVAENSVSDEAYRPDDVITYRNGVTVEVTNTDAEGRLVLADGLCWAAEKENPSVVVDIATLTGGVVIALGKVFAGVWANDEGALATMMAASEATDERIWRLPLHAEYRDMMKSPIADIQNSNANRQAHPVQGAAFLSYFVPEGLPWIHLDIAGVHAAEKDHGPWIKGPNGFGVSLLAEFAYRWSKRTV